MNVVWGVDRHERVGYKLPPMTSDNFLLFCLLGGLFLSFAAVGIGSYLVAKREEEIRWLLWRRYRDTEDE